jgi:hypothetical protein
MRLLDMAQAARPAGARHDPDGDPGPDCRICPVCRGIAYLREVDPRAVERLTGAVAEVAAAVRDLLGATAPDPQRPGRGTTADERGTDGHAGVPRVRVQQIQVTD